MKKYLIKFIQYKKEKTADIVGKDINDAIFRCKSIFEDIEITQINLITNE